MIKKEFYKTHEYKSDKTFFNACRSALIKVFKYDEFLTLEIDNMTVSEHISTKGYVSYSEGIIGIYKAGFDFDINGAIYVYNEELTND